MPLFPRVLPLGVLLATVVGLSGCSALEGLGIGQATDAPAEEVVSDEGGAIPAAPDETETAAEATGFVLPTCDTLYSADLNATLLEQVRVNMGDTSDGNYGYGTTNLELVGLLKAVRGDLRISCTWYLPASESGSVTSLAIIAPDVEATIAGVLSEAGAVESSAGGGTLWTIDDAASGASEDYIATEAHFMAPVACPASLAETSCIGWFSTNYSFGQAENLTVDAARNLGVYTN
jgi:hypothetical protein